MKKIMKNLKVISSLIIVPIMFTHLLIGEEIGILKKGLEGLEIKSGQWQTFPNETLVIKDDGIAIIGTPEWENYTFEVTCKILNTQAAYPYCGLFVRYQNSNNYILLLISPIDHYYYINEYLSGEKKQLDKGSLSIEIGVEYKLKLICNDEEISFSLDGKEICRVETKGNNYCGKVGFLGARQTEVSFSSPTITELSIGNESNIVTQIDFDTKLNAAIYTNNDANNLEKKMLIVAGQKVNVPMSDLLSVSVKGDGRGHVIGVVLTDNKDEKHFLGKRKLRGTQWKDFVMRLDSFLKVPVIGNVTGKSWGGDGNQKIDFPIKELELVLFDEICDFDEKNGIDIGQVKFYSLMKSNAEHK